MATRSNFNTNGKNLANNGTLAAQAALKLQEASIQWAEASVAADRMAEVGPTGKDWSHFRKIRDTMLERANAAQAEAERLLGQGIAL